MAKTTRGKKKTAKKTTKKKTTKKSTTKPKRQPVSGKKEDRTRPPPAKTIDELESRITERYKGGVILARASKVRYPFHIRRPTGIPRLDAGMVGGWPAGSINQIFGPDGAGKNGLAYHTCGAVQDIYGDDTRILLASLGYGTDRPYARLCGLRIAFADYEIEQVMEEAAELGVALSDEEVEDLMYEPGEVHLIEPGEGKVADTSPTEAILQTVLEAIRSGLFQVIVLDEGVGAGASMDAISKDIQESEMTADQAQMLTKFMKRLYYAIRSRVDGRPNQTTVLVTAQTRMKIQTSSWGGGKKKWGGPEYEQTGGQALKHGKAMDVHLTPGKWIRNDDDEHVGKTVSWFLAKAKLGTHEGAKGKYDIRFDMDGMIDIVKDGVEWAIEHEAIKLSGSYYTIFDAKGKKLVTKQGEANLLNFVRKDPEIFNLIMDAAKHKAKAFWRQQ
jgi:RecA/RadA recombinase